MDINSHIQNIKENGYTIIPQAFNPYQVEELLELVKYHYEDTKNKTSKDVPYLNKTSPNVYNLQNKDLAFIKALFGLKDVEEILKYFLNDEWYKAIPQDQPNYILRHIGARSSNEALPLHIDSFIPYQGEESMAMQVAIMLEDSFEERGCTFVIPGSHQSGEYADPKRLENRAIPLECSAGDILVWDSRIHHSTSRNETLDTRWAIIATYTRWFVKQMFDIPNNIPDSIYFELSQKEKYLLGFGTRPFRNEFDGIEMKRGYDEL